MIKREYRIVEEIYANGSKKFIPQGYFEEQWKNLADKHIGINNNDYCKSIEEAQQVIDKFKEIMLCFYDGKVEEIIHKVN